MTALGTFRFYGYELRPARFDDRHLAQAWTLADTYHRETTPVEFWIEQKRGRDSYLLSDGHGPVFFFKMHLLTAEEAELHIQFPPILEDQDLTRTREGLAIGFSWLEKVLLLRGMRKVTFDSSTPELAAFCRRRLGFTGTGERLTKDLDAPSPKG